ncbi:MAG: hypothetical protein E6Q88_11475 [Lysobacteraceae bacterium]|nr:MAG: hypothetical protein E6Q88_11475 [Xanthomonadaceae bacterium]
MKRLLKPALLGAALFGMGYALVAYAYPMPGENQEVYVEYYSNSARTTIVGTRGIAHGGNCMAWHATWGATTAYSRVFIVNCPTAEP